MQPAGVNLELTDCRLRQQRVRDVLERQGLERAILVSPETVQYLTGWRPHRLMQAAVSLEASGECLLAAPNQAPERAAADRIVTFAAQRLATLRQDQAAAALAALATLVPPAPPSRIGVEFSCCGQHVRQLARETDPGDFVDLDGELWTLRRRKDPDEIRMIRRAIACTEAMYATARDILRPGITELEVFARLHSAAVDVAGEPLTALGNDYQCNSPGGPPRTRPVREGELIILDLGPAYRGYYADNCRTFAVGGAPSTEQQSAWTAIVDVLRMVEETVRPGVACRDVYRRARQMLDEQMPDAFFHHLGHGFGLFPHEAPHLNPHWDDVFEEGDVFTAEPGLYAERLRAGIRLEQNYRVTASGIERLTHFPLEL